MKLRTWIVKRLVGREFEIYECKVCGRLHTDANDLLWHINECAYRNAGVVINMSSFRAAK